MKFLLMLRGCLIYRKQEEGFYKVLPNTLYLLSRIRINQSNLNLHRFSIGLSETAACSRHAIKGSSLHYLTQCFLYSGERQTLYNLVEHYIPNFSNKSKKKQYEILVMGINTDQSEFNSTNTTISIAVQKFIITTKRFS